MSITKFSVLAILQFLAYVDLATEIKIIWIIRIALHEVILEENQNDFFIIPTKQFLLIISL